MTGPVRRRLIVDDHDLVRRGVRALVETHGRYQIVGEAADGREALALVRTTSPDIVILDYSLPELNGLDLTISLKRENPRLEVLIYTMHEQEEVIVDILRAGARAFVLKSDPERHLIGALDALAVHRPYFSSCVSERLLDEFLKMKPALNGGTLTHREREIVQMIAEGRINKEIGALLGISVKTVETHRAAAMQKLKLRTTADLVRYAVRNNIVSA